MTESRHIGAVSPIRRCKGDADLDISDGKGSDGGYVLILSGLLMLPLLAFVAMAVDIGAWYAQGSRLQRAADAGALAGVVYATDSTKWNTVARDTLEANGITEANSTISVLRDSDAQVTVTVERKALQFFSSIFLDDQQINRTATAEYVVPVPMGSPTNRLGNDPDADDVPSPHLWLNIAGRSATKVSGDRHTSTVCSNGMWGCSGTVNSEYTPDGYFFKVAVGEKQAGQDLVIDAFDPGFVYTGDRCESGNLPSSGDERYRRNALKYCPGDQDIGGANLVTTYIVRAPDNTPLDNTDNPPICAISFDPVNSNVSSLLDNPNPRGRENAPFRDHFHTWFRLCTIPASQVVTGDYFVQVRTNADLTNRGSTPRTTAQPGLSIGTLGRATTPSTGGHNRFALRSGWTTSPTPTASMGGSGLGISADGRLPIYVNVSANSEFYVARITPDYAGKILQLSFWDIGDGASATDVTVKAPADASNPPTSCTYKRDGGSMTGVTVSGCTVRGMTSGNYNGKIVTLTMPMPADYSCATGDPEGCWFKIEIGTDGSVPNDTTTWSANVIGDPVHLIR